MQGLKFDASTRTINFLNKSQVMAKSIENNHHFKTTQPFWSFLFDNKSNVNYTGKKWVSAFAGLFIYYPL